LTPIRCGDSIDTVPNNRGVEAEHDEEKFSTKIEEADRQACFRQHPQTERATGASTLASETRRSRETRNAES